LLNVKLLVVHHITSRLYLKIKDKEPDCVGYLL
jgi:hypothetical protein